MTPDESTQFGPDFADTERGGLSELEPDMRGSAREPAPQGLPLDATHDPKLRSWVDSANSLTTHFPIQNLPYGRFRARGTQDPWRIGVAIGDQVLDLHLAVTLCPWPHSIEELLNPLAAGDLNAFMALGRDAWRTLRQALSIALRDGSVQGPFLELCLIAQSRVELGVPCRIGDYTDFYAGIHHATAVGRLSRPDSPLLPNYKHLPIAYHGRSSSIVPTGQRFRRPHGQMKGPGERPVYGPTQRLEFELELGVIIGPGNTLGEPVTMEEAEAQLFGMVMLNDWSARDIQAWENQPLGPFLAKSFATTVSPWVVTMDALAPYRRPYQRPAGDPDLLPYLDSDFNRRHGAIDVTASVWLQTAKMRAAGDRAVKLSEANFAQTAYWTLAQLVAHQTANGCNLQTGDLLASGALSGVEASQGGSLLELTGGGRRPLLLPNGEQRTFLLDGDTVWLAAHCLRPGVARVGFGKASGTVVA